MQYFYSAFSSKRMSTASSSSTASAASRECSKSVVTSDLRVSWCRLEDRLPETSSDEEKQHRSINNRISELCNTTLLALEKMQTGHLKKWGERCFWVKDSVSVDHLNRRPGSFSETLAPRCADLLERLSNFWVDFENRYFAAGFGHLDEVVQACLLPDKFSCYGAPRTTSTGTGAVRGDVVPAMLEWISVPKVDPIPIESISPRVAQLMSNWEDFMLLSEKSLSPGKQHVYEDPVFASASGKLGLARILHQAGMIGFVKKQRGPAVKCFCVLKSVNEKGEQVQRLIFDLRGTNAHFAPPPYCGLANASNFAYIDLSPEVILDGELQSWQGDIPNFFYRLQLPESLTEYFVLAGVTAEKLCTELGLPPPEAGRDKVAIRVCCMGWSWAPYLAQTCAEDVISSIPQLVSSALVEDEAKTDLDELDELSETWKDNFRKSKQGDFSNFRQYEFLRHAQCTPQFYCPDTGRAMAWQKGILYVYIDDFGGWVIQPPAGSPSGPSGQCRSTESDMAAARDRLNEVGLGCHKELLGLPRALGYQVVQRQASRVVVDPASKRAVRKLAFKPEYFLKGEDAKLFPLVAYTSFILRNRKVAPQKLCCLLGGLTWFVLINRPILSVFDSVYSFINVYWKTSRYEEVDMWDSVYSELQCLLGMLPFLEVSLSLSWAPLAYEVDAGPKRTAVLSTPAEPEVLRVLGRLAERGGWLLRDDVDAPSLLSEDVEDRLASAAVGCSRDFARSLLPRSAGKPQEVDSSWFSADRWQVQFVHVLRLCEHNTISEVRAAVQAVRHFASSPRNWHHRLAVLSDAGAAIGCLSKGRSSSRLANSLCRQAAAAICVADLRVYFRWVSSANNCADGPSRGSRRPGVDSGTTAKAAQAARKVWDAFAAATAAAP